MSLWRGCNLHVQLHVHCVHVHVHVPPLVLKARHLSGSAFCCRFAWAGSGMVSPRFGIGYGRLTYWAFMYMYMCVWTCDTYTLQVYLTEHWRATFRRAGTTWSCGQPTVTTWGGGLTLRPTLVRRWRERWLNWGLSLPGLGRTSINVSQS